mmetsp:Transcript_12402/g.30472  ORF Transcript_12402/g.30472 Transcript_12402/m.30472 type:complete len:576 (-) Transcript_12402:112-1839(-)
MTNTRPLSSREMRTVSSRYVVSIHSEAASDTSSANSGVTARCTSACAASSPVFTGSTIMRLSGVRSMVVPSTVKESGMSSAASSCGVCTYVSTPTLVKRTLNARGVRTSNPASAVSDMSMGMATSILLCAVSVLASMTWYTSPMSTSGSASIALSSISVCVLLVYTSFHVPSSTSRESVGRGQGLRASSAVMYSSMSARCSPVAATPRAVPYTLSSSPDLRLLRDLSRRSSLTARCLDTRGAGERARKKAAWCVCAGSSAAAGCSSTCTRASSRLEAAGVAGPGAEEVGPTLLPVELADAPPAPPAAAPPLLLLPPNVLVKELDQVGADAATDAELVAVAVTGAAAVTVTGAASTTGTGAGAPAMGFAFTAVAETDTGAAVTGLTVTGMAVTTGMGSSIGSSMKDALAAAAEDEAAAGRAAAAAGALPNFADTVSAMVTFSVAFWISVSADLRVLDTQALNAGLFMASTATLPTATAATAAPAPLTAHMLAARVLCMDSSGLGASTSLTVARPTSTEAPLRPPKSSGFASFSSSMSTPYRLAISASVSPSCTTWKRGDCASTSRALHLTARLTAR